MLEIEDKACHRVVVTWTSAIQPGVREDTLRFSFLSFRTYLIHYFGSNLFYLF
jgi:hypothetical protein